MAAAAAISAALVLGGAAPAGAHWWTAEPVDNDDPFRATSLNSAIAAGSNGVATALFFQATPNTPAGQVGDPYMVRRPPGEAWGAPASVATSPGSIDAFVIPDLASTSDGDTLGVFQFRDSTPRRVTVATGWPADAAGPGAATPALCSSGAECSNSNAPQVALDGAGKGYAVDTSGFGGDIVFAERDAATGTWGAQEVVANGAAPQLAVSDGGDVVIVYSREDTSNPAVQVRHIYAKRRLAGETGFGPEVRVSTGHTVERAGHALVITDDGDATIVWPEDTLPPGGISPSPQLPVITAARWFRLDAEPDGHQAISEETDGQARFATAAVDPAGRVTAVWTSFAGHSEIFAAENANGWGPPQHVSPEGSNRNATRPDVAVDAAGTATVVYQDNASPQGGDLDVKASRRPAGGTWSAPHSLRMAGGGAGPVQGFAHVAAERAGQADVIFVQQQFGVSRLVATRFDHAGYPRPKSAASVKVSLVPAYAQCTTPNRVHGPPLAFDSCAPPAQRSGTLTVGTPDANGAGANATGSARFGVVTGDPDAPPDEADVNLSVSLSDVRNRAGLSDYTGELQLNVVARVTDREDDGAGGEPSTIDEFPFTAAVPCTATGATGVGASCTLDTTFDALVPGAVVEHTRAVWQLGQVRVFDGGADGVAGTDPNTVFAVQGVFAP